jgi:GNAT superfamily N-acetyltransferase
MSDAEIDALAEMARNRGLKLVRSRVRTPGKRRFGKVGLADSKGKPVFGLDDKGPAGKPEDVEDYLRNLGAKDWGASLDVAVLPRKRKPEAPPPTGATAEVVQLRPRARPKSPPKPKPAPPPPTPKLRDAKPADAPRLVELIAELGHEVDERQVRRNLAALKKSGETPLVCTLGRQIVGMCGIGRRVVIHRPAPLGRITALIVAKEAQGQGIGRMLVQAAEEWMRKERCPLIEVTSNDSRADAHAFYRHMGYERSSIRFFKRL